MKVNITISLTPNIIFTSLHNFFHSINLIIYGKNDAGPTRAVIGFLLISHERRATCFDFIDMINIDGFWVEAARYFIIRAQHHLHAAFSLSIDDDDAREISISAGEKFYIIF